MADTARTTAREAARTHLAARFPDHGMDLDVADGIADAVRVAVLAEVEVLLRDHVGSPLASALFSNGVEFAADLVHDLAATAPTSQETPDA